MQPLKLDQFMDFNKRTKERIKELITADVEGRCIIYDWSIGDEIYCKKGKSGIIQEVSYSQKDVDLYTGQHGFQILVKNDEETFCIAPEDILRITPKQKSVNHDHLFQLENVMEVLDRGTKIDKNRLQELIEGDIKGACYLYPCRLGTEILHKKEKRSGYITKYMLDSTGQRFGFWYKGFFWSETLEDFQRKFKILGDGIDKIKIQKELFDFYFSEDYIDDDLEE